MTIGSSSSTLLPCGTSWRTCHQACGRVVSCAVTVWDLARPGWCWPRRTRPDQLGLAELGRGLYPETETRERGLTFLVGGIGEQVNLHCDAGIFALIIQHANGYPYMEEWRGAGADDGI